MKHQSTLTILLGLALIPALVTGCDPAESDAGELSELGFEDEELSERSSTCEQACSSEFQQCRWACPGGALVQGPDGPMSNPCWEECYDEFDTCKNEDFQYASPSYQICHLDVDQHLFDVDIEFYTADVWEDQSCAGQQDHYKKRYMGKVSCSNFSALFDSSSCAAKIESKLIQYGYQGYTPTFPDANVDACPWPRL
ncbi:hypothetical protein PPSIR1_13290 [Plesiocystis pacifica SIR-1]|uniref:Uncharacterized protein n=1 Tax=Plesiocystis pacifica SIR-1 TaxID=391625 RepID=A6GB05_9BACT|nr:hypothetical protein [Plesiocystis pacifica]EDM76990.1 hypothetical protein PPSIR1_13290 [Plesiocystis pacifica SIR-1]